MDDIVRGFIGPTGSIWYLFIGRIEVQPAMHVFADRFGEVRLATLKRFFRLR